MSRLTLKNLNTGSLHVKPVLLRAVIQNISLSAINCAVDGEVSISISSHQITIIDNGVGLDSKPRGDEGFGIGLNLVRDIFQKYNWQFSLTNNKKWVVPSLFFSINKKQNKNFTIII